MEVWGVGASGKRVSGLVAAVEVFRGFGGFRVSGLGVALEVFRGFGRFRRRFMGVQGLACLSVDS